MRLLCWILKMNQGWIILALGISGALAGGALASSFLALRRLTMITRDNALLREALDYYRILERRRVLVENLERAEKLLQQLKGQSKQVSSHLSGAFAGVAGILKQTHELEGNPRPRIETEDLVRINNTLLSVGENSLNATRIADSLLSELKEAEKSLKKMRSALDTEPHREK